MMSSKEVMKQAFNLMSGTLKEEIKNNLENPRSYTRLFVKISEEIDTMKVKLPKFTTLKNDIFNINKQSHSKITEEIKYSVPEFLQSRSNLTKIVKQIKEANIKDGGQGAFYIYLKNIKE